MAEIFELVAETPCAGLLPLRIGALTAAEADLGTLSLLMPYQKQSRALSAALKEAHGMALPGPNRSTGKAGARAIWFGRDQVLLAGPAPDAGLAAHAAVSDQSDAWACISLQGAGAEDVLARLVPVDLRSGTFKRGHTVRTLIGHMNGSVTRTAQDTFVLLVFRSMAATLVHELKEAMETQAARAP